MQKKNTPLFFSCKENYNKKKIQKQYNFYSLGIINMKKYYINSNRVTKKDFEGYLYLLFCRLTNNGREQLMDIMNKQNEQYNYSKNTLDDDIIKSLEYKD